MLSVDSKAAFLSAALLRFLLLSMPSHCLLKGTFSWFNALNIVFSLPFSYFPPM